MPQEVDALILKGMADNRDTRPQSAAAYRQSLIAAVNRMPVPAPVNPGGTKSGGNPALWIGGAVAAVFGLIIVGVVISAALTGFESDGGYDTSYDTSYDIADDTTDYRDVDTSIPEDKSSDFTRDTTSAVSPQAAYYSGRWADGIGGYYNLKFANNGSFTGSGRIADGTSVTMRGGITGTAMQYIISVQGRDVAQGRGVQADQCHFNFQTFDAYGNVSLTGKFHVNHEPGDSCP